jgi:hypothetical protein
MVDGRNASTIRSATWTEHFESPNPGAFRKQLYCYAEGTASSGDRGETRRWIIRWGGDAAISTSSADSGVVDILTGAGDQFALS